MGLPLTYANEFAMNKEDTKWPKEGDVWCQGAFPKQSTKCLAEWVDEENRLFLLYSVDNRKLRKSKVWGKVVSFCVFLTVLSLLALSMVLNYYNWMVDIREGTFNAHVIESDDVNINIQRRIEVRAKSNKHSTEVAESLSIKRIA